MKPNLRERGNLVNSLCRAINDGTGDLENVPRLVKRVIITEAWRARIAADEREYKNNSFLEFITDKPLKGCGWSPVKVEALLKDVPEVLAMWRDATTPKQGAHRDNVTMKREGGNSRAYTLARLKRERPDLFKRVVAGELSANAAAIEAEWRKPPAPLKQLRKAWKAATPDERTEFLAEISAGSAGNAGSAERPQRGAHEG